MATGVATGVTTWVVVAEVAVAVAIGMHLQVLHALYLSGQIGDDNDNRKVQCGQRCCEG